MNFYGHGYNWGMSDMSPIFILLALWSIFWKGLALWHSAERGQHRWFIAILLINTAGILEIVYLFAIAKLKMERLFKKHHGFH